MGSLISFAHSASERVTCRAHASGHLCRPCTPCRGPLWFHVLNPHHGLCGSYYLLFPLYIDIRKWRPERLSDLFEVTQLGIGCQSQPPNCPTLGLWSSPSSSNMTCGMSPLQQERAAFCSPVGQRGHRLEGNAFFVGHNPQ